MLIESSARRAPDGRSSRKTCMAQQSQKPEHDPTALAHAYAAIAQRSSQLMTEYMKRQKAGTPSSFGDELGIAKAFYEMSSHLLQDPAKFVAMQMQLWQ